jgi:Uma2 family endonuclease
MSIIAPTQPAFSLPLPLPPPEQVWRITVERYDQMIASGSLNEDDPIELLSGVLVTKMAKNPKHSTTSDLCRAAITRLLTPGWYLRQEQPVRIPEYDEPEPDLALARGSILDYQDHHPGPGDIALIVEVAESSLPRDRGEKRDIYARAGIPAYWIINLVDRQLEAYLNPAGGAYPPPAIFRESDTAELIIAGQVAGRIAVAELLPKL